MLKIRLSRAGRKNLPFYRIVLTEAKKAPQHGYQKVLGFYNPLTKELSFDKVEAEKYIQT
jgi:small subunit ribosomal protein S16